MRARLAKWLAEAEGFVGRVAEAHRLAHQALTEAQAAVAEVRSLRRQLAAAMALDVGFHETGKLILLTRIGDQDRCRILDLQPTMTVVEYRDLVERLQHALGVGKPGWVDAPPALAASITRGASGGR